MHVKIMCDHDTFVPTSLVAICCSNTLDTPYMSPVESVPHTGAVSLICCQPVGFSKFRYLIF